MGLLHLLRSLFNESVGIIDKDAPVSSVGEEKLRCEVCGSLFALQNVIICLL